MSHNSEIMERIRELLKNRDFLTVYGSFDIKNDKVLVNSGSAKNMIMSMDLFVKKYISDPDEMEPLLKDDCCKWVYFMAQGKKNSSCFIYRTSDENYGYYFIRNEDIYNMIQFFNYEHNDFFETILNFISEPIFFKTIDRRYTFVNEAFLNVTGISRDELLGKRTEDIFKNETGMKFKAMDLELISKGGSQEYEYEMRSRSGGSVDVIYKKVLLMDRSGNKLGIVGIMNDITKINEEKAKSDRLSKIKDAVIDISHSIFTIKDIDELLYYILGKMTEVMDETICSSIIVYDSSRSFLKIKTAVGYSQSDIEDFKVDIDDAFFYQKEYELTNKPVIINNLSQISDYLLDSINGEKIVSLISVPLFIGGEIYGFLNLDSNKNYVYDEEDSKIVDYFKNQLELVFERFILLNENRFYSNNDYLTRIYNRKFFMEKVYIEAEKNLDDNIKRFFVLMDLDKFKEINDQFGHYVGDKVLLLFVEAVKDNIDDNMVFARLGGDEFAILLVDKSVDFVNELIDNIKKSLMKPVIIDEKEYDIAIEFSSGIGEFDKSSDDMEELYRLVDKRMYIDKSK